LAHAQLGPGGGMGGMGGAGPGGPTQPAGEEKKEGVAEAAPKNNGLLPTTPSLPPQKSRRKRFKLLELDGYYRVRTDYLKNFNLGFNDDPTVGGAPFPRALGCQSAVTNHPCDGALTSTNMRLRLEPTINIDEGTSVHFQADLLDNLVFGSTPYGEAIGTYTSSPSVIPPVTAFGNTTQPPVAGVNSNVDSILIKRAWAEVAVPLGVIKVGRMPNHWGMGLMFNGGGYDPVNGTYDFDADGGDSVDRAAFTAAIPGTKLRAMIATDWALTRLTSNQTSGTAALIGANLGNQNHPYDLDDTSNATGFVGVLSKMDSPQDFKDAVDRGETVLNYGIYFEYKTQDWDENLTDFKVGGVFDAANHYVDRELKTYTPDLWGKLGIGAFTVEAEVVAQLGRVDQLNDLGVPCTASTTGAPNCGMDIRKFGGVGRMTWKGLDGKLHLGIETGAASGDQYDNTVQGQTNIAFANSLGTSTGVGDPYVPHTQLTQFIFNPEYKVDLILFRHLLGAVTNAAYFKPFLQYDITKSILVKVWNVSSFALKPVATPGNGVMYGTEFDSDVGYAANGIFAGISAGVLFPFGAMAHPSDDIATGGTYGYTSSTGVSNTGDPGTAYTIQSRLVLQF
jgi:uncharacterized protein (TIGR04551 family)